MTTEPSMIDRTSFPDNLGTLEKFDTLAKVFHIYTLDNQVPLEASLSHMATTLITKVAGSEAKSCTQTLNVGTRKSKLALVQTDIVVKALTQVCPAFTFEVKARDTAAGDIDKVTPFKDMAVKNIWTHELETLMLESKLDFIVHSLKGG